MKIKPEKADELREEAIEKFGEAKIASLEAGLAFEGSGAEKEILLSPESEEKITVGVQESVLWTGSKYWKQQGPTSFELKKASEGKLSSETKSNFPNTDLFSEATLFLFFRLKKSKND